MPAKRTRTPTEKANRTTTNGTNNATTRQAPANTKSTTQPPDLSESAKLKLKQFFDRTPQPFTVKNAPASKKRKRDGLVQIQNDLWEDKLSVQYEVAPKDIWESLRRYKKFTSETFDTCSIAMCTRLT